MLGQPSGRDTEVRVEEVTFEQSPSVSATRGALRRPVGLLLRGLQAQLRTGNPTGARGSEASSLAESHREFVYF